MGPHNKSLWVELHAPTPLSLMKHLQSNCSCSRHLRCMYSRQHRVCVSIIVTLVKGECTIEIIVFKQSFELMTCVYKSHTTVTVRALSLRQRTGVQAYACVMDGVSVCTDLKRNRTTRSTIILSQMSQHRDKTKSSRRSSVAKTRSARLQPMRTLPSVLCAYPQEK